MATRRFPSLRRWRLAVCVAGLALAQAGYGYSVRHVDPARDYLSPVPSISAQEALAFGDRIFLHRLYALIVQNAGDTGGRIVPVRAYDFGRVVGWLEVLTRLDARSEFSSAMAAGYFGQSQNVQDVAPIARFIMRDVATMPEIKWRWLYHAVYLARHRLQDDGLALQAARQLASYDFPDIDPMAAMTPAFILEDAADYRGAIEAAQDAVRRFGPRMRKDDAVWASRYLEFLARVDAGLTPPRKRAWN